MANTTSARGASSARTPPRAAVRAAPSRRRGAAWAGTLAALSVAWAPAASGAWVELSGHAFGTTWRAVLAGDADSAAAAALGEAIGAELAALDAHLSTWRDDSELSRFNASASTDWWPVSPDTAAVAAEALDVARLSGGAFDPTVGPLVALWGFGPDGRRASPPDETQQRAARARVGAAAIAVRAEPPALRKRRPDVELDLSGVAKGFAVDALAERLAERGVERFLLEVGGEVRVRGAGPDGGAWSVGIERPDPDAAEVGWVVPLRDAALATSGDYRRFFEWGGERYSHLIDPRSGRPVRQRGISVSVRAERAARADAWATALLVLGPEEGRRVAERLGIAALFVTATDGGRPETRATAAWDASGVGRVARRGD